MQCKTQNLEYECIVRPAPPGQIGWVTEYPDLFGCWAAGETPDEAFMAGKAALVAWLEHAEKIGHSVPEPGSWKGSTGSIRIRIPKSLHRELGLESIRRDTSLNEVVVRLVSSYLGRRFPGARIGVCGTGRTSAASVPITKRRPPGKRLTSQQSFSGSWVQRMPRAAHQQLQVIARDEDVSLNLLIATVLAQEIALSFDASPNIENEVSARTAA